MGRVGLFFHKYWWKILYLIILLILRKYGYIQSNGLFDALILIPVSLNQLYHIINFKEKEEELHLGSSHTPRHLLEKILPEPLLQEWVDVKREFIMSQCLSGIAFIIYCIDILFIR